MTKVTKKFYVGYSLENMSTFLPLFVIVEAEDKNDAYNKAEKYVKNKYKGLFGEYSIEKPIKQKGD